MKKKGRRKWVLNFLGEAWGRLGESIPSLLRDTLIATAVGVVGTIGILEV